MSARTHSSREAFCCKKRSARNRSVPTPARPTRVGCSKDPGIGRSRRPCPPPRQGDHRTTEEASALPLPTSESQRRQREGCRRLCVLRQGSMGEIEPPRDDESLLTGMVRRTDGLAQSYVGRPSPAAGFAPAHAGLLKYQSKEPDAWPACPVL